MNGVDFTVWLAVWTVVGAIAGAVVIVLYLGFA